MSTTFSQFKKEFIGSLQSKYTEAEAQRLFEIGCEEFLNISRLSLLSTAAQEMSEEGIRKMQEFQKGLLSGIPYQHLLGEMEFGGVRLKVGPQALIPRPETEELAYIIKEENQSHEGLRILDIGTGTGCLALACANFFHKSSVTALDVSLEAMSLAKENAAANGLEIDFFHASILEPEQWPSGTWDIIVSNPPYIGESESSEMDDLVKHHEPSLALFVPDDDVLVFYRMIREFAQSHLAEGGKVYLEINQKWGPETIKLYSDAGFSARLLKDLSGNDRFVVASRLRSM